MNAERGRARPFANYSYWSRAAAESTFHNQTNGPSHPGGNSPLLAMNQSSSGWRFEERLNTVPKFIAHATTLVRTEVPAREAVEHRPSKLLAQLAKGGDQILEYEIETRLAILPVSLSLDPDLTKIVGPVHILDSCAASIS